MTATSSARTTYRGVPVPLLVATPLVLAAGWVFGAGIARVFRARASEPERRARVVHDTRPPRPLNDDVLDREEVVRALLDSDHERFDELGRTVHFTPGDASERKQGAAPIDLRNVDE